jgi:hypothetical protein
MKQILKKTRLKFNFSLLKLYYVFSILAITILSGVQSKTLLIYYGCRPQITLFTITVIERTTNKPIAGATVSLKIVPNRDFVFGCTAYSTFTTLTTNTEGKATSALELIKLKLKQISIGHFIKKQIYRNVILTPKTSIEGKCKKGKNICPNRYIMDRTRQIFQRS